MFSGKISLRRKKKLSPVPKILSFFVCLFCCCGFSVWFWGFFLCRWRNVCFLKKTGVCPALSYRVAYGSLCKLYSKEEFSWQAFCTSSCHHQYCGVIHKTAHAWMQGDIFYPHIHSRWAPGNGSRFVYRNFPKVPHGGTFSLLEEKLFSFSPWFSLCT